MDCHVRRYKPEDEEALFAFRKTIFPQGSKDLDPDYFRWKFIERADTSGIPFFVLESYGRIVGTLGYWLLTLTIGDLTVSCGHLVDFNVDKAFRGLPTLKLYRAVSAETEVNFGANISADARRFFGAARWLDLSCRLNNHYLYLMPSEADNALKLSKYHAGRSIAKMYRWNIYRKNNISFSVRLSNGIPEDLEHLLDCIPERKKISFMKDYTYYFWRYGAQICNRYNSISLFESGIPKAAIIFYMTPGTELRQCTVMDIICNPYDNSKMELLLCELVTYCDKQKNVELLTATSLPSLNSVFKACGFRTGTSTLGLIVNKKFLDAIGSDTTVDNLDFMMGDTDLI